VSEPPACCWYALLLPVVFSFLPLAAPSPGSRAFVQSLKPLRDVLVSLCVFQFLSTYPPPTQNFFFFFVGSLLRVLGLFQSRLPSWPAGPCTGLSYYTTVLAETYDTRDLTRSRESLLLSNSWLTILKKRFPLPLSTVFVFPRGLYGPATGRFGVVPGSKR